MMKLMDNLNGRKGHGPTEELAQLKKDANVWSSLAATALIAEAITPILLNRAALPFMLAFFILLVLAEYEYFHTAEQLTTAMRRERKEQPSEQGSKGTREQENKE